MKLFRQGDVLLIPIAKIPRAAKKADRELGKVVLAYGEATGHHHAIADKRATKFRDDLGLTYLEIAEALADSGALTADLTHEEHATIPVPSGKYQVLIQREYSPEAIRNVMD